MKWSLILLLLLLASSAAAQEQTIRLLAVSERNGVLEGSMADLSLRTEPGDGRVFIDSQPLTRIDTQISTRFAKQTVCAQFNGQCDSQNFFYTMKAPASIVGGPSAGAAAALLTLGILDGHDVNRSVAITGTINSGGLIGPVGSILKKIEAGAAGGVSTVLIPAGERFVDTGGIIVDAREYGRDLGVEVIEVSDIYEAAPHVLGAAYPREQREVELDPLYAQTMARLSEQICNRTASFEAGGIASEAAAQLAVQAQDAATQENRYSQASFCFGANIQYSFETLKAENLSQDAISTRIGQEHESVDAFGDALAQPRTLTQLQSHAIVQERLAESRERLNTSAAHLMANQTEQALFELAFAHERLISAQSWAEFLTGAGNETRIDTGVLEDSCRLKLAEAQERVQYVRLLFERQDIDPTELREAEQHLANEEFGLCLFAASKAKAEANTVLSLSGLRTEQFNVTLDRKLQATKESILRQGAQFPIAGYSYYEYAGSLRASDPVSAMLFAEYALEMSSLDVYVPDVHSEQPPAETKRTIPREAVIFAAGLAIGVVAVASIRKRKPRQKRLIIRRQ